MATQRQGQIVETPTEARQAEPGPSVLALLTVSTGLAVLILGVDLVRVLPHLTRRATAKRAREDRRCRLMVGIDWNSTLSSPAGNAASRMSLTYVIPDIHGRYDLLCEGLADIATHAAGTAGVIVTIGDYVDKGPQSKEVIDRLLSGVAEGWRLVALKGNHDAMMVQALRDRSKMARWIEKGGDTALTSYGGDPAAVPQTHIAWLDGLRLMHVDNHRLYVHAGVDPEVPLGRAERSDAAVETLSDWISGRVR